MIVCDICRAEVGSPIVVEVAGEKKADICPSCAVDLYSFLGKGKSNKKRLLGFLKVERR